MDKGVQFTIDNFDKALKLCSSNASYKKFYGRVYFEYLKVKAIKHTGNMIEHFSKFEGGKHKYANDFLFLKSYGILTNEEMADYLRKNYPDEINNYSGIDDLIPGNVYTNNEIVVTFGVAYMGGMRKSNKKNALVLIADHSNPLYDDQWTEDGILNYTGMGKTGDQDVVFAQNWTMKNLATNGVKVYLFESYKKNEYYYDGEVELAAPYFFAKELDDKGKMRKVVKFPLRRKDGNSGAVVNKEDVDDNTASKRRTVQKEPLSKIKEKAKAAGTSEVTVTNVQTTQRNRNQYVDEFTKIRANGVCDLCGQPAPFLSKGKPYLECHHVTFLADGGPDAIYNTVALCPNCHRKMHIVKSASDLKHLKKKIKNYLEADNDQDDLDEFKKLYPEIK